MEKRFSLQIFISKKVARRDMIVTVVLCGIGIAAVAFAARYQFVDLGFAALILFMGITAGSLFFIDCLRRLMRRDPVMILTEEGVQVFEKRFSGIGVVGWKDITGCRELCEGGIYAFFVRDNTAYYERIADPKKRKKFQKMCKTYAGAVLWIARNEIDFDPLLLKKTVAEMIERSRGRLSATVPLAGDMSVGRSFH